MSVLLALFVRFGVKFVIENLHSILICVSDCHKNRSREGHIYAFNVKNAVFNCVRRVTIIETNRLVLYREIVIGCSEICNKHKTTMGREWNSCILHLVKVKPPVYRPG
jgi:hypothetical protein